MIYFIHYILVMLREFCIGLHLFSQGIGTQRAKEDLHFCTGTYSRNNYWEDVTLRFGNGNKYLLIDKCTKS